MKGSFKIPLYQSGGGESPDPAVFCPLHGYLPPYEYFNSPIEVSSVSNESIVFILDTEINPIFNRWYVGSDTNCNIVYTYYDENGNLLDTQTQAAIAGNNISISQTIPASPTRYVKCVVTLDNGSALINRFQSNITKPSGANTVAVIANIPNVAGTVNCRSHLSLKILEFTCTLNYVTAFDYLFHTCGVERFTMPVSMPALTSMQYALIDAYNMREFVFPSGFSAPNLITVFYFSARANAMESFALPDIPSLYKMNIFMYLSTSLKAVTINGCSNVDNISQLFEGCTNIEQIELPEFPIFTTGTRLFTSCLNLKKLTLNGTWSFTGSDWLTGCYSIKEIHYPRTLKSHANSLSYSTNLTNLSVIHLPDYFDFSAALASSVLYYWKLGTGSTANNIKKIYGDCEFASGELKLVFSPTYYRDALEEVNCPKLKVSKVDIGANATTSYMKRLTTVVVDWTNSTYSGTSPQIRLAAPLTAAQLDAIFTALPTVTGKTIDVRYCDGYSGCTKSIAQAKGWTVY